MEYFRYFDFRDNSQRCWDEILEKKKPEAQARARALIAEATADENGCLVTDTKAVRKVRFGGWQFSAYRFVYCALTETSASGDQVIRRLCHNRRCINLDHLTIGSKADNKRDDWEFWANGVDRDYIGHVSMYSED